MTNDAEFIYRLSKNPDGSNTLRCARCDVTLAWYAFGWFPTNADLPLHTCRSEVQQ